MQKKQKNNITPNQNAEIFDFSSLELTFMGLIGSQEAFPVDFEEAWQWIGFTRKDNAKRLLEKNSTQLIDYQFFLFKEENSGAGRTTEIVSLTTECFKTFCMLAQTERGREVRAYYLEMEKKYHQLKSVMEAQMRVAPSLTEEDVYAILNKQLKVYACHAHVIDVEKRMDNKLLAYLEAINDTFIAFEERVVSLENTLRQALNVPKDEVILPTDVYLIQEGDTDIFKIGNSIDTDARTLKLATGNSQTLTIVKTIHFHYRRLARSFEAHLHEVFASKHIRGEWHKLNADDLGFIDRLGVLYEAYQMRQENAL